MALDIGLDKPAWWDDVLESISTGTSPTEALAVVGKLPHHAAWVTDHFEDRATEWRTAVTTGRQYHVTKHLAEIERQVRAGIAPQTAAMSVGLAKHVWRHFLLANPAEKAFFTKLAKPVDYRPVLDWLIHVMADEKQKKDDFTSTTLLLGAIREIMDVVAGDLNKKAYRAQLLLPIAKVFAYRDDTPAVVLDAIELDEGSHL